VYVGSAVAELERLKASGEVADSSREIGLASSANSVTRGGFAPCRPGRTSAGVLATGARACCASTPRSVKGAVHARPFDPIATLGQSRLQTDNAAARSRRAPRRPPPRVRMASRRTCVARERGWSKQGAKGHQVLERLPQREPTAPPPHPGPTEAAIQRAFRALGEPSPIQGRGSTPEPRARLTRFLLYRPSKPTRAAGLDPGLRNFGRDEWGRRPPSSDTDSQLGLGGRRHSSMLRRRASLCGQG
jgi:hypothetical protein